MYKECAKCHKNKAKSEFHAKAASRDGLNNRCKDCVSESRGCKTRLKPVVIDIGKTTAAYLAGLIDGEGHVYVSIVNAGKRNEQVSCGIRVGMTGNLVVDLQQEIGLGSLQYLKSKSPKWKDSVTWSLSSNACRVLLPLITPYLRVKKQQAILLQEYLVISSRYRRRSGYKDKVRLIYEEIRRLNCKGRGR